MNELRCTNGGPLHRVDEASVCLDCGATIEQAHPETLRTEAAIVELEHALGHETQTIAGERDYIAALELELDRLKPRLDVPEDHDAQTLAEHLRNEVKRRKHLLDEREDRIVELERELNARRAEVGT